jgi:hypothetical protein
VLEWAREQGIRRTTRLLEALVDSVKQHRQKVNAVGKEAVDDLRQNVVAELIKKIEAPIRRKCQAFVKAELDVGTGVRDRILELFDQLADDVVEAASTPAISLLVERFKEVDKEILTAFGDHSEPLNEAAEALIQRQEKKMKTEDTQADKLSAAIEVALVETSKVSFSAL